MATNVKRPIEGSDATRLDHMPPIRVTTEGIPAEEHLEVPLAAASAPTKTTRGQRASRLKQQHYAQDNQDYGEDRDSAISTRPCFLRPFGH